MDQYLPWLYIGLGAGLVIAGLLYIRLNQVESD
jgi:hypothetical protein